MKIELSDDTIELLLKNKDGSQEAFHVDALELRMVLEECEKRHTLEQKDGFQFATREFLQDVARGLVSLGIEYATVSMAYAAWAGFSRILEAQKKSTSTESESGTNSTSTHLT
jgi:hypothetical protein